MSCLFIGLGRVLEGVRERIMLTCLAYLFVLRATERQLDVLVNKLRLPKPGKKIARGHIKEEYGPIYKNYRISVYGYTAMLTFRIMISE